jgi:hypothetical protein
MAPIDYESFTVSFLQCGGYYVDALLDAKKFPNLEIPNSESLFADACSLLPRYVTNVINIKKEKKKRREKKEKAVLLHICFTHALIMYIII